MAFLSLLDNRARPKGSRDPLGFEMVWSHYGRQVIGNLTTITSVLPNFAVAILGFQWANDLHRHLPEFARQALVRDSFLRYEQMAGYLRYLAGDERIMGITRVSRRMGDKYVKVTFGLGAEEQILSDQASYGLWGLYSAAMRDTGLVSGDLRDPTGLGRSIAGIIDARLDTNALVDIFSSKCKFTRADLKPYANSYLAAINDSEMQEGLIHLLMNGQNDMLIQQEMWRVTQTLAKRRIRISSIPQFIDHVRKRTKEPELARRLTDIEQVERVLVAANNIFEYCRRKDGESVKAILTSLGGYDFDYLPNSLDLEGVPHSEALQDILSALRSGNTELALMEILQLNRVVMEQRGGAPWVEVEPDKTLRVRVQSETSELKGQRDLEQDWDYDYFLKSYIHLGGEGLGVQWTLR